ncbi:hypothetical protein MKW92_051666 [Papaver armeniacum]|nr:hypothetical protein MKW92_051666 [Papaver armeniacum]
MLRSFSTMLSDTGTLQDKHKNWVLEQMEEDNADEPLSYAIERIQYWDGTVNELDKDVQSEIRKQKKRKFKFLKKKRNEYQADDNCVKRKGEVEELDHKISSTEKLLDDVLFKRSTSYYETLWSVGDRSTLDLQKAFFTLLRPDEDDLAKLWLEEAEGMQELIQKEKEQEKKARDICGGNTQNCD